jgi:F5/8 type C domain
VSHGQAVDAAVNPPFVATEPAARNLRASLPVIGMGVKEARVGELRVLEVTPQFTTTFVPLPRDRWTVTTSDSGERAGDLIDGDVSTVWDSRGPQEPGQWLAVDLGTTEPVTRIDVLAIDWQNIPGSFRVEVSEDGQQWNTVATAPQYWGPLFFSEHHPFLKVRRGRVQAIFPPVRAHHVRLVNTATLTYRSWTGRGPYTLLVLTPTPPPRRIDKTGWTASASENSADARRAIDGNRDTRWVSGTLGAPD